MRNGIRLAGSRSGASLAVALMLFAGCSSPSRPVAAASGTAWLALGDSPFPFDLVSRADIFVVSISAGIDSGAGGAQCSGAKELVHPNRSYDLMLLQPGKFRAEFGPVTLPAGDYAAVCITIDTDRSSITLKDGTVLAYNTDPGINWSASGQRTIKTNIVKPIHVPEGGPDWGNFFIHFDLGRSFIPAADVTPPGRPHWFYFVPSIEAMDPADVGHITGTVTDGQNGSAPIPGASLRAMVGDPNMAPDTWFVAATATTDTDGHFVLPFLQPSAHWASHGWVYTVEVYPPTTMTRAVTRLSPVDVTAGALTAVGEIPLN